MQEYQISSQQVDERETKATGTTPESQKIRQTMSALFQEMIGVQRWFEIRQSQSYRSDKNPIRAQVFQYQGQ